jgi:hypothetical protein
VQRFTPNFDLSYPRPGAPLVDLRDVIAALFRSRARNSIKGRTWVKGHLRWRGRPERQATVFVKSSIASAKARAAAIVASDPTAVIIGDELPPIFSVEIEPEEENTGWLYVMRCPLMDDEVYKIGLVVAHTESKGRGGLQGNWCAHGVYRHRELEGRGRASNRIGCPPGADGVPYQSATGVL